MPAEQKLLQLTKAILERVFKEGVESIPKGELDKLFKGASNKLYRIDRDPGSLLKKGFDAVTKDEGGISAKEMAGLYWANSKRDLKTFIKQSDFEDIPSAKRKDLVVEGLKRPGSSTGGSHTATSFDNELSFELDPEDEANRTYLAAQEHLYDLNKTATEDFVDISRDEFTPAFKETVQRRPNNTLAKIKYRGKDYYRILALLAALKNLEQSERSNNGNTEE